MDVMKIKRDKVRAIDVVLSTKCLINIQPHAWLGQVGWLLHGVDMPYAAQGRGFIFGRLFFLVFGSMLTS